MIRGGRVLLAAAFIAAALAPLSACSMFGGDDDDVAVSSGGDSNDTGGLGVNSYLWRATLDTLSFMPLASADPFGGVIITDWYSDPSTPTERFKATVYILDTNLRADALNVSIFRQETGVNGWQDAAVSPETAIQIEDAILRKARELRLAQIGD